MLFSETLLPLFCALLRVFPLLSYKIFIFASSANFLATSFSTILHIMGVFFAVLIFALIKQHFSVTSRLRFLILESVASQGVDPEPRGK